MDHRSAGPLSCHQPSCGLDCGTGQSKLHMYFAQFSSLQIGSQGKFRHLKATLILLLRLFCNLNCFPLPHPIATSGFPTHDVTQKQDLTTAQKTHLNTYTHMNMYTQTRARTHKKRHTNMPEFPLNLMTGVGPMCDDGKLTEGFTLFYFHCFLLEIKYRRTLDFQQLLQLKDASVKNFV